jgi:hypothetical protein
VTDTAHRPGVRAGGGKHRGRCSCGWVSDQQHTARAFALAEAIGHRYTNTPEENPR